MRAALDTNVLISAYATRGLSADVFRYILAEHKMIVPDAVLAEFERVFANKFGMPKAYIAELIAELRLHETIPEATVDEHLDVIRDPDDRKIVAAAINGSCDIIVTGDRDILDMRDQVTAIRAMTPREFWESIRGKR